MNAYVKLFFTAPLWASAFIAGQVVARQVPPMTSSFLRMLIASVFMVFFLWRGHVRQPKEYPLLPASRRDWFAVALLAFFGIFLYNLVFMVGLISVPGTRAATIIPTNPAFLVLIAWLFYGEKLGWVRALGTALAVTGSLVVVTQGHLEHLMQSFSWADLWLLAAIACWVVYVMLSKPFMRRYGSLPMNAWAFVLGTIIIGLSLPLWSLTPLQAGAPIFPTEIWQTQVLMCLFIMGFGASALAFVWYFEGQREVGVIRAAVFISLIPVMAMFEAYVFLQQTILLTDWIGAVLVGVGIYCVNRPSKA